MDNQEAFNRMVTHLRKQGCKSIDEPHGCCRYRAESGARCAVGVLITDEFYSPQMEDKLIIAWPLLNQALPGVSLELLTQMQFIHDCYSPEKWERLWEEAAEEFQLSMPVLEGEKVVEHALA